MKTLLSIIIAYLLLLNCSSDVDVQTAEMPTPLTDVLTLELTFGAEGLQDEYLLARPQGIQVNDAGDIYVNDEMRIKIFDKNGKEKAVIGGPGEGPGEFGTRFQGCYVYLSPTEYITEIHAGIINVFKPDYSLVSMTNFSFSKTRAFLLNEFSLSTMGLHKVISIDEQERLFTGESNDHFFLVHEKEADITTIAQYESSDLPDRIAGTLLWDVLPGDRVVYTHPFSDNNIDEENNSFYTLHIVRFDGSSTIEIQHDYKQVAISKIYLDLMFKAGEENLNRALEMAVDIAPELLENAKKSLAKLKDVEFYGPLKDIQVDDAYIFAITYTENEKNEVLTDVFDGDSGKYINSVYFPFTPEVIKKEYAYGIGKNEEGFYVVEKYKIDPAVYGK